MVFREEEHPRDGDGKFTDKHGGRAAYDSRNDFAEQVKRVARKVSDAAWQTDKTFGEFDEKAFDSVKDIPLNQIRADSGWLFGQGRTDSTLHKILHAKGYDRLPKVVSKEEIDDLVKQGYTPIFRGIKYLGDDVPSGAEQYKRGEMFVGRGAFGHGVYFATNNRMAAKYSVDKDGKVGSILSGVLDKSAKIISADDAKKLSEELISKTQINEHKVILSDLGKVAALYGYDAIKATEDILVVLNRGKTIIGE